MKIDYDRYEEIITNDLHKQQNQMRKLNNLPEFMNNQDGFRSFEAHNQINDPNLNEQLDIPISKPNMMLKSQSEIVKNRKKN